MMRLVKLSRTYHGKKAVDGVSARIDDGDFIIIRGHSGSGKSTLLKMMGGLILPDEGQIWYGKHDLSELDQQDLAVWRRRNLGFVFQQFELIDYLSAMENVRLPMLYAGMDALKAKQRAEKLLDAVGLKEHMDKRPGQLSGGQAQRVAIARSLANSPSLILCDEPTGALDPESAHMVMRLLKVINSTGRTVVVVTHQKEMEAYGSRIWHMENGRIPDA